MNYIFKYYDYSQENTVYLTQIGYINTKNTLTVLESSLQGYVSNYMQFFNVTTEVNHGQAWFRDLDELALIDGSTVAT